MLLFSLEETTMINMRPNITSTNTVGVKYDEDKNRLDLIEPEFIEGVGQVLTMGADKYEENSWQKVENAENRYYAAAMRHLLAWRKGEKTDEESGLSHLYHVATNMMFLAYFDKEDN